MRMLEIGPRATPALRDKEAEHEVVYMDAVDRMGVDVVGVLGEEPLPFADSSFDLIFCGHILEHIEYYHEERTFMDLFRVLKDGGQLHVYVPNGKWIGEQLANEKWEPTFKGFMFGGLIDKFDVHLNVFTPRSLVWRMQYTGLDVYSVGEREYEIRHGNETGTVCELQVIGIKPKKE